MPPHGPVLSCLDTLCCPEADGPTNLEQPTLNHVQSDTMASAVLADSTRAPQGTNRGSGPAMEVPENDVGSLEQLLLYAFASAWCLEIVCGTIVTPTSARIVERVTVGSTSACRTILRSSLLVVFLVAPDPVFRTWVLSSVHCSQQFLTAHSEQSTWPATRRVDQPVVFIPMIRPLSNSLNCEKCLLARLPSMFRLPKSSYNRRKNPSVFWTKSSNCDADLSLLDAGGNDDRWDLSLFSRCNTARDDRRIVLVTVMDRAATSQTVAQQIQSIRHHSGSPCTIRCRLRQSGMSARRPLLCLS
ncbi:uncharacterized protein TNCV_4640601 [Trichonephila clavipes]|nr:uncharacterized protein TNCV_4640601 [Trichonephila clavipes]